jgi:hypothetical protein
MAVLQASMMRCRVCCWRIDTSASEDLLPPSSGVIRFLRCIYTCQSDYKTCIFTTVKASSDKRSISWNPPIGIRLWTDGQTRFHSQYLCSCVSRVGNLALVIIVLEKWALRKGSALDTSVGNKRGNSQKEHYIQDNDVKNGERPLAWELKREKQYFGSPPVLTFHSYKDWHFCPLLVSAAAHTHIRRFQFIHKLFIPFPCPVHQLSFRFLKPYLSLYATQEQ